MKFALVNPRWTFDGSTYFGCKDPHFPLELLSAREMLRLAGQNVLLIDAMMDELTPSEVIERLDKFGEDFLVIPTAPSYLFWRCPQPELRVPRQWISALARRSKVIVIGPHGSVTPRATPGQNGCRRRSQRRAGRDTFAACDDTLGDDCWLRLAGCCYWSLSRDAGSWSCGYAGCTCAGLLRLSGRSTLASSPHFSW